MSNHDTDSDCVELSLQLSGLAITIRGAPDRAADFVRRVSDFSAPSSALPAASSNSVQPVLASVSDCSGLPVPLGSATTQASVQDSFLPCPDTALASAASHLKSTRVSSSLRAKRAWLAGQWALAAIEGRITEIPATPELGLPQKYWVVLKSPRCRTPRLFQQFGLFTQEAGSLSVPGTIGHEFATETEAFIYLESAGFKHQVQYYN